MHSPAQDGANEVALLQGYGRIISAKEGTYTGYFKDNRFFGFGQHVDFTTYYDIVSDPDQPGGRKCLYYKYGYFRKGLWKNNIM